MTLEEFNTKDSTFVKSLFLTKVNNIFIQFFTNIMKDELEQVDHFISDNVYQYGQDIIDKAKSLGCRQMYDELNVKSSEIVAIEEDNDNYKITVFLEARYIKYLISLDTGEYVSGNNEYRILERYELEFIKKKNTREQKINRKCPTCGASIDVNANGKCEYCGSIYNQEDYDWVLNNIKVI